MTLRLLFDAMTYILFNTLLRTRLWSAARRQLNRVNGLVSRHCSCENAIVTREWQSIVTL
jgi:hypothetical protein